MGSEARREGARRLSLVVSWWWETEGDRYETATSRMKSAATALRRIEVASEASKSRKTGTQQSTYAITWRGCA